MKNLLFFALCLLFCTGCATATLRWYPAKPGERSSGGTPVLYHLEGMNTGVYLFYCIPLWSGSPGWPNQRDYDMFRHQIREKDAVKLIESRREKLDADRVEDVKVEYFSTGVRTLWIFWKRWFKVSGVAVKTEKMR